MATGTITPSDGGYGYTGSWGHTTDVWPTGRVASQGRDYACWFLFSLPGAANTTSLTLNFSVSTANNGTHTFAYAWVAGFPSTSYLTYGTTANAHGTFTVSGTGAKSVSLSSTSGFSGVSGNRYLTIWGVSTTGSTAAYMELTKSLSAISVNYTYSNTYTVSYNGNGSGVSNVPGAQTKTHNVALTLSSTTPTQSGYKFLYWSTNSTGSGTKYNPGSSYTANASVTLYAIWRSLATYTITYNANGGTGAPSAQTKTEGVSLTLSTTKPTSWYTVTFNSNGGSVSPTTASAYRTFVSWNTMSDGSGTPYAPGASYTADASVTLYAIWKNSTLDSLPTPTRANCQFHMWTTTLNGNTQVTTSTVISSATTIYAKWKYGVTFNGNGGIVAVTDTSGEKPVITEYETITIYKTHGTALTIPANYTAYKKDSSQEDGDAGGGGYTPSPSTQFEGWGRSSTTSTVSYLPGSSYTTDSPITLYAVYATNTYTVIFTDGYTGTVLKQYNKVPHGSSVTPPPDPTRPGYTFSGWLGDYSCILSDTTIQAFWGFTPVWIWHNKNWVKYTPEEEES